MVYKKSQCRGVVRTFPRFKCWFQWAVAALASVYKTPQWIFFFLRRFTLCAIGPRHVVYDAPLDLAPRVRGPDLGPSSGPSPAPQFPSIKKLHVFICMQDGSENQLNTLHCVFHRKKTLGCGPGNPNNSIGHICGFYCLQHTFANYVLHISSVISQNRHELIQSRNLPHQLLLNLEMLPPLVVVFRHHHRLLLSTHISPRHKLQQQTASFSLRLKSLP